MEVGFSHHSDPTHQPAPPYPRRKGPNPSSSEYSTPLPYEGRGAVRPHRYPSTRAAARLLLPNQLGERAFVIRVCTSILRPLSRCCAREARRVGRGPPLRRLARRSDGGGEDGVGRGVALVFGKATGGDASQLPRRAKGPKPHRVRRRPIAHDASQAEVEHVRRKCVGVGASCRRERCISLGGR